jgi:5'-nucleotidase
MVLSSTGNITLGDILEILPFEDPLVVLQLDGEALWAALEASLETWPAQEGYAAVHLHSFTHCNSRSRFPVISGFRVSWDSRRPPGQRVLGVWLVNEAADGEQDQGHEESTPRLVDGDEIKRHRGGRKFNIVTREYMAQGHDGFLPLKGQQYLIDDESGQLASSVVRKYLLGEIVQECERPEH